MLYKNTSAFINAPIVFVKLQMSENKSTPAKKHLSYKNSSRRWLNNSSKYKKMDIKYPLYKIIFPYIVLSLYFFSYVNFDTWY